jgi:hypothetical protein
VDDLATGEASLRPCGHVRGLAEADDEEREELFDHAGDRVGVDGVLDIAGEPVDEREPVEDRGEDKVRVENAKGDLEEEDVVVPGDLSDAERRVLSVVVVLLTHRLAVSDPEPVSELSDVDDD